MRETTLRTYRSEEIRGDYSGNDLLLIVSSNDDGRRCYASKPTPYGLGLEVSRGIDAAIFNDVDFNKIFPSEGICDGTFNEEVQRLEKLLLVIPQEIPA